MKRRTVQMLFIALIFFSADIFGQAQLIQSFIEENIAGSNDFGYSVSTAGDVNNDGYDDVIVGAMGYKNHTGEVYIYYGGSSMDATADVTITGETELDEFGYSASTAGDVNGDGYDDVIIGAPRTYSNTSVGKAYIFFGGNSMDNTADVSMIGSVSGEGLGRSVSNAGDVNNDGYDDVIIGEPSYNSYKGRALIYYGSSGSSMDSVADVTINGTGKYFGRSVSYAGNVNGDDYSDVIVGEPGFDRCFIYYGGNSMDGTDYVRLDGEKSGDNFGISVSNAGDVNNDGYDDVIVGANYYDSYRGRAYVFFGKDTMAFAASPDVIMTGENEGDKFGQSVAYAGDVNKDTYADVIVGAWVYNTSTGRAYIYYGSTGTSMDNVADVTMTGETTYSNFGYSVSTAGDVDNDGYDDVIVGAQRYHSWLGRAYVLKGAASMDNSFDVTFTGKKTDNYFGYSVAAAGDVNGDNYDDIIVGANNFYFQAGRVYIYFGGSSMDNTPDLTLTGVATHIQFGVSVSTAGDVNNDGYDDVIVGASYYNSYTGRAYVYFGGDPMDDGADAVMAGESTYNYFGGAVSTAGDVNNDGYDDVIIAASGYNSDAGRAYIYFGNSGSTMDNTADVILDDGVSDDVYGVSVSTAGDVNGDNYDDVIVGADNYADAYGVAYIYFGGNPMNTDADVTMYGENKYDHFGFSVSTAGDVNGDNYDDVIVSAVGYSSHTGRAYIFYGDSATSMDNTADVTMEGEASDNYFGEWASNAGDVNNDGYDDVIVGADGYNSYTGRAYVYYGGNSMDNTADITVTGEGPNEYFGFSVSGAGDVNGDNYDDFIVGAYNYPENGKAYLYSGPSAPVPVELASFTAETNDGAIRLNWTTATEMNNYGFEVERQKAKGKSGWAKIGFVEGHGNSNSPKEYSFTDENPPSGNIQYRLKQIDIDGDFKYSEIVEVEVGAPLKFELFQNYPNPFNPTTTITYVIARSPEISGTRQSPELSVQLIVYDALGREVATLVNKKQAPGKYSVQFDASRLNSGVYFYRISSGNFVQTRKMIFLK